MKKCLSILLAVVLLLTAAQAFAVSYTLPEKMQRQLEFGSGLKGSFTVDVTGTGDIAARYGFLNGREYQLRGLTTEGETQYLLYCEGENETQPGMTRFWNEKDSGASWLDSEFLKGKIIEFPAVADIPLRLAGFGEEDNPPFYGILMNFLGISEEELTKTWEPVLKDYYSWADMWLSAYADAPTVDILDGGETVLKIAYQIPSKAIRSGVNDLIGKALKDEKMTALLGTLMTEAEKETYLNPNYADYYKAALESLPLEGNVTLDRTVTTRGEQRSLRISFPVTANEKGWETLVIDEAENRTVWYLNGQGKTLSLCVTRNDVTDDSTTLGAYVCYEKTEGEDAVLLCADVSFNHVHSNSVDSDNREHDTTTFSVSAAPAAADPEGNPVNGLTFAPITLKGELHFSSKNAPNSPTTLVADIEAGWQDTGVKLNATLKTASPWVLQKLDHAGAVSLMAMSDEEKLALLNEFIEGASAFFGNAGTATEATVEPAEEEPAEPEEPADEEPAEPEANAEEPAEEEPAESEAPAEEEPEAAAEEESAGTEGEAAE